MKLSLKKKSLLQSNKVKCTSVECLIWRIKYLNIENMISHCRYTILKICIPVSMMSSGCFAEFTNGNSSFLNLISLSLLEFSPFQRSERFFNRSLKVTANYACKITDFLKI